MIFRRIKAHIEKENRFAESIDFAIFVLSVFAKWHEHARRNNTIAQIIKNIVPARELAETLRPSKHRQALRVSSAFA